MTPSDRDVSPRLSAESSAMPLKVRTNPSTGGTKRTTFRKRANMTCLARQRREGRAYYRTHVENSELASNSRRKRISALKVNWDGQERHVPIPLCYRASG